MDEALQLLKCDDVDINFNVCDKVLVTINLTNLS